MENPMYTDPAYADLLSAIKGLEGVGKDYEIVSAIFEDLFFWDDWISDPEPVPPASMKDNPKLFSALSQFVGEEGAKTVYDHVIGWEFWYWDRKAEQDQQEYRELSDAHFESYGQEYGDTFNSVFDGTDVPVYYIEPEELD